MKKILGAGFTLLEIIVVIVIVGVLAGLALPRFFHTVDYSRSTEALNGISAIREAVERCYVMRLGTYAGCDSFGSLSIEDPGNSPNAHFSFSISGLSATNYILTATRNTRDTGDGSSTVTLTQNGGTITRSGTGVYLGIQ